MSHPQEQTQMHMFDRPADMAEWIGQSLGTSDWLTIDQQMIDLFAEATGDRQWIHVDLARARTAMPGGKTIAHGFLLLSLLPRLASGIYAIRQKTRGINYGINKVRFTAAVPAGARVRLHLVLIGCTPIEGGMRLTLENTLEQHDHDRPCLVAETIFQIYE